MFNGKAYQWTQVVDIVAGRDVVLELTADNAEVEPPTATASASLTLLCRPGESARAWSGGARQACQGWLITQESRVQIPPRNH